MTLLVVLQNYISLSSNTPRDVSASWLGRFTLVSFLFNIAIFTAQIFAHFGLQAQQWLDAQRAYVNSVQKWDRVLYQQRHRLDDLFQEWDTKGNGHITKKQFLRGIKKLTPATSTAEARSRHTPPPQTSIDSTHAHDDDRACSLDIRCTRSSTRMMPTATGPSKSLS